MKLKSFSDGSASAGRKIWLVEILFGLFFIETLMVDEETYGKWVFIKEGDQIPQPSGNIMNFRKNAAEIIFERIQRFLQNLNRPSLNLYAVGFSHASYFKKLLE
ncbi:hypothetical protein ACJEDN_27230 [Klebsiella pneumoniae]